MATDSDKTDKDNTDQPVTQDISKKRRLRTNTETVRERSQRLGTEQQKSIESAESDSLLRLFWNGFTLPARLIWRQLSKLGRFRVVGIPARFIGRILLPKYIRNSWRELRLVTWPDRPTSIKLTYAVIVFSVIFGIIVALVDWVLGKVFKELILQ